MKRNKMLSLDDEIVDYLSKQPNASSLVNRLLKEHINKETFEGLNKQELEAELAVNKVNREAAKAVKELRANARR